MDNIILKAAGDSVLDVKAYVTVGFDINGIINTWTAFVVPISEDALIAYKFCVISIVCWRLGKNWKKMGNLWTAN